MAWEYVATGLGGMNLLLVGYLIKSSGTRADNLDKKIDLNREVVIAIYKEGQKELKSHFKEVCNLKQSKCHGEVTKDITANRCNIERVRQEKKEMWSEHMRKCHREGCPE